MNGLTRGEQLCKREHSQGKKESVKSLVVRLGRGVRDGWTCDMWENRRSDTLMEPPGRLMQL